MTSPTQTLFTITVIPSNEGANDWFVQATEADLCRTFESARDLANDLASAIVLRDAAGFQKGRIEANGDYQLS